MLNSDVLIDNLNKELAILSEAQESGDSLKYNEAQGVFFKKYMEIKQTLFSHIENISHPSFKHIGKMTQLLEDTFKEVHIKFAKEEGSASSYLMYIPILSKFPDIKFDYAHELQNILNDLGSSVIFNVVNRFYIESTEKDHTDFALFKKQGLLHKGMLTNALKYDYAPIEISTLNHPFFGKYILLQVIIPEETDLTIEDIQELLSDELDSFKEDNKIELIIGYPCFEFIEAELTLGSMVAKFILEYHLNVLVYQRESPTSNLSVEINIDLSNFKLYGKSIESEHDSILQVYEFICDIPHSDQYLEGYKMLMNYLYDLMFDLKVLTLNLTLNAKASIH